jgi:hypothetical protein
LGGTEQAIYRNSGEPNVLSMVTSHLLQLQSSRLAMHVTTTCEVKRWKEKWTNTGLTVAIRVGV